MSVSDTSKNYVCYYCEEEIYFGPGKEVTDLDDGWKFEMWRHVDSKYAMCRCYASPSNIEVPK